MEGRELTWLRNPFNDDLIASGSDDGKVCVLARTQAVRCARDDFTN